MTTHTCTGDLDLARFVLQSDAFVDGHVGTDPDEHLGEVAPTEPGVTTVHLNGAVASDLLIARGWAARPDRWTAPDGETYWTTDEALTVALTAEVL